MNWIAEGRLAGRLPMLLLTGFLGSGKTTLLNHLLAQPELAGTAVAINEFGEVPLDNLLVSANAAASGGPDNMIVLGNGCVCCTVRGDLENAMLRLFAGRGAPGSAMQRLIIEASGIADPTPIVQTVLANPRMSRQFRLAGVVATVDALFGAAHLADRPEAVRQVLLADRIVLTKTDLVAPAAVAALRTRLGQMNPAAEIVMAMHGQVPPTQICDAAFLDPAAPAAEMSWLRRQLRVADDGEDSPHGDIASICLSAQTPLPWENFNLWLRRLRIDHATQLLRFKGIVGVANEPRPILVQGVHHVLHPPVALDAWPDGLAGTRLVLITQGVAAALLRQGWDDLVGVEC